MEPSHNPAQPPVCACGFFGNSQFSDMCSKCYREHLKRQETAAVAASSAANLKRAASSGNVVEHEESSVCTASSPSSPSSSSSFTAEASVAVAPAPASALESIAIAAPAPSVQVAAPAVPIAAPTPIPFPSEIPVATSPVAAPLSSSEEADMTPVKLVQENRGRCWKCRSKVSIIKQATNECKCGFVFCDSHRHAETHECSFDHATAGRAILAKNNPKLHDRPPGGRNYQRIDS